MKTILEIVGGAVGGFLVGYIVGYYGTMKLVVVTLNKAIAARESSPMTAAQLELPGLTLFRAVIRHRLF